MNFYQNNIPLSNFSCRFAVNTLRLHYKYRLSNYVQENTHWSLCESYRSTLCGQHTDILNFTVSGDFWYFLCLMGLTDAVSTGCLF